MRILFLSFLIPFSVHAAQVATESAYVRSGAGTQHSVVEKLVRGDELKVVEKKDDWFLVETEQNNVGWIQSSVLKGDDLKTFDAPAAAAATVGTVATTEAGASVESPKPAEQANANNAQMAASPTPLPTNETSNLTNAEPTTEFKEISLAIRPGYTTTAQRPTGMDDSGTMIGGHVGYYILRYVGLSFPFTYTRFSSNADFYSFGGGPIIRFLDKGAFRGSFDINALYVRGLDQNHFGWNLGGDFTVGFPKAILKPFVGPFMRYERVYIGGNDLKAYSFGLGLTLTSFAEID